MNVEDNYIGEEITNILFDLLNFNDKINFTKTNKELFVLYKDRVRCEIFRYVNYDYLLFHECLKRFKYTIDEQNKLMETSLHVNNIVNKDFQCGKYIDLRFIFELCYYLTNDFYKKIDKNGEYMSVLPIMIKEIYNSISFNRFETILNIEKKMILCSLRRSFKPILWKTNDPKWIYLVRD